MRIVMFLFHTFHNDHRVLKEARSLVRAGNDVTLIAMRETDDLPEKAIEEGIEVRRLRLHKWPFRKGRFLEYFLRAGYEGWKLNPDVYHCHDLDTLLPGFLGSIRRGAPLVYDSHELYSETHFLIGRKREQSIWNFLERHLIRHTSRVITVSDPIARELRTRYSIEKPVVVRNIPELVPLPSPTPFFKDNNGGPIFLCQGYMQPGRGLEVLIHAMKFVPRGRLVLLGNGEIRDDLQTLLQRLDLTDRVHLFPAVPLERLLGYTACATVGLIAYSTESLNFQYALPNKFFEYLMAGVPVLTSNIPEVAQLVRDFNVGRIVEPCDPYHIARELNSIVADPDKWKKLSENCRKAVRRLQWAREEEKLLHVYSKLSSHLPE